MLSLKMTGATDADLEAIDWIEKDVRASRVINTSTYYIIERTPLVAMSPPN